MLAGGGMGLHLHMPRMPAAMWMTGVVLCLCLCLAEPVLGQQRSSKLAREKGVVLAEVVAQLNSDDFAERERAGDRLAGAGFTQDELEVELARADLSAEQVWRVSQVAFVAFCDSPRGALGVSFGGGNATIEGLEDGFPAGKVLKIGDQLTEIGGVPVAGRNQWDSISVVRPLIISHNAGEIAKVVVVRDGRRLSLDVPLGSFRNLRNAMMSQEELMGAWRVRLARIRPAVIEPGVRAQAPEEGWMPTGVGVATAEEERRLEGGRGLHAVVVAGGLAGARPRANNDPSERAWNNTGQGRVFVNPNVQGMNQIVIQPGARFVVPQGNQRGFKGKILTVKEGRALAARMRAQAADLMEQSQLAQRNAIDPGLPAPTRRAAEEQVARLGREAVQRLMQAMELEATADIQEMQERPAVP